MTSTITRQVYPFGTSDLLANILDITVSFLSNPLALTEAKMTVRFLDNPIDKTGTNSSVAVSVIRLCSREQPTIAVVYRPVYLKVKWKQSAGLSDRKPGSL